MPRGERPLDAGDGVLLRFAHDLRQLRQKAGSPTYRVLAGQAHYSVAALSEAAAGRKLPTLAVTLAYVRACDGDVTEWERRWHSLATELSAPDLDQAGDTDAEQRPPYVGLAAFQAEDADRFFGRERLADDLMARLAKQPFVAVFGASGAGKSSVLRAGLIPRWGAEHPTEPIALFTPGPNPMEECAIALARVFGGTPGPLQAELDRDRRGLHRLVRQGLAESADDNRLLLIVDQFEEVFTLCRDDGERSRFIQGLVMAARAANGRCRIVLGIRADFYTHCTAFVELVEALQDSQITVGSMTPEELRLAITKPATLSGCTVETALLAQLVAQLTGQIGGLPLLSHALLETWRRRRGNTLTLTGFQAAGGIEDALAQTAESVYTRLSPRRQRLTKDLMLRLTALGDGTEDTKRRIIRSELDDDTDTTFVLDRLVGARLIALDRDSVEISHEALIRSWPRLRE
uniref:WD-40 repeat protein n=1 Tax=uncultured bacterium esnapd14 TaxID=1366594 RepID=S5UBG8_9BACT|nr:WD-40 repeat protein [uncultured bacterium esnapd14]